MQDGTAADSYADLTTANIPAVADDYAALWAVRLYDGQTAVAVGVVNTDVYDLRFSPMNSGGANALEDHDHSGDAGDGGQFPAVNLTSDVGTSSADDGFVLTADGAGNTAWEVPAVGASALDDLTDVTITTPADNDILTYDDGTSQWINEAGVNIASDSADISAVNFTEQADDPTAPGTGHWLIYAKSGGVYIEDDASAVKGPLGQLILATRKATQPQLMRQPRRTEPVPMQRGATIGTSSAR